MARQTAMTQFVNPTLEKVAIYTIVTSLAFVAISLILGIVLATVHATTLIITDTV